MNFKPKINRKGFTLIELMVSMAILAVLSSAGLSAFISSQIKGRDAKRKEDLQQLSRALELYYNDYGEYPASDNGRVALCGTDHTAGCSWGTDQLTDSKGTTYMQTLPKDPLEQRQYFYYSTGTDYALYAWLENTNDTAIITPAVTTDCDTVGNSSCNYGVASSKTKP